jgi:hypothetical protein
MQGAKGGAGHLGTKGYKGNERDEKIGGAMRAHYREDPALVDGVGCDFVQLHSKPRGPDSRSDSPLVI